jgi:Protein of unknown function (DUF433)
VVVASGAGAPWRQLCYGRGVQAIQAELPPIEQGDDGVIRIAGTRVTLDSLVASFDAGATPEEIVQQFPSLSLPDTYAAIS